MLSDDQLVRAARGGDRTAFDALVARHGRDLERFLGKKVGRAELEDLVQETWVAAWGGIRGFDGSCRFRTWLFGISLFKVRDHYRQKALSQEEIRAEPPARLDPAFGRTDLRTTVQGALAALTDAQREVLELYYFVDLTLPEVARVLNRNLNTVKYQFYRAHAVVAEELETADGGGVELLEGFHAL
jgi:RNA polymerase sigma-70 factor, ECF subfamily